MEEEKGREWTRSKEANSRLDRLVSIYFRHSAHLAIVTEISGASNLRRALGYIVWGTETTPRLGVSSSPSGLSDSVAPFTKLMVEARDLESRPRTQDRLDALHESSSTRKPLTERNRTCQNWVAKSGKGFDKMHQV